MDKIYEPVIGLEIHVELSTDSKMFCRCSANYFNKPANSQVCPVCLGLPGAMPVPNKKAIEWTVLIGKALNCTINKVSKFDRKHYFYPDLPKGYQISQYDEPLCVNGYIEVTGKRYGIIRVHLEEDTGKLIHQGEETLVDFNRSGVPLVEIVTKPHFTSSDEIRLFGETLQETVRRLKVSEANMEEGSMRIEPNISVKKLGQSTLPTYKVEIKNINSFNFAKKAIEYEIARQTGLLKEGKLPTQETRGYDEAKNVTVGQRTKEEAHDYRYFPEPDIPPLHFTDEYLDNLDSLVPNKDLPINIEKRIFEQGVKQSDAHIISMNSLATISYDRFTTEARKEGLDKQISNLNQGTANIIVNKKVNFEALSYNEFKEKALEQLTPIKTSLSELAFMIEKVIENNQKVVEDYKNGKQNAIMFLVGQVMKEMKGKADAVVVREYLLKRLQ